ncbi:MAG: hypothetical protein BGO54_13620 [Sphingobacteriales bacterium 46-32]|nr:MAG: hypothetical protein BGO54_13620 [Sphingobacteriales bacterium 46-32]
MLPGDLTGDLIKRLNFIKGQIEAITRMLDEGKDPDQISIQFKAADQALQKAHFLLLDEVFRKSLALKLVKVMNACPGNCPDAEKIELLKQQFPLIEDNALTQKMKEINEIGDRLAKYNEENPENSQK